MYQRALPYNTGLLTNLPAFMGSLLLLMLLLSFVKLMSSTGWTAPQDASASGSILYLASKMC